LVTGVGREDDRNSCRNVTAEVRRLYNIVAGTKKPLGVDITTLGGPNVKSI
jgi:hypothetical protein